MITRKRLERYWEGISKYYLTHSQIIYCKGVIEVFNGSVFEDKVIEGLIYAGFGIPGLYLEKYTSMNA